MCDGFVFRLNRPLTMSEKVLYSHIDDPVNQVGNYCTLDKNHLLKQSFRFPQIVFPVFVKDQQITH